MSGDDGIDYDESPVPDAEENGPIGGTIPTRGGSGEGSGLPGWITEFGSIAKKIIDSPVAWIISVLTALSFSEAKAELIDHGALSVLLDQFLFEKILLPIADATWAAGEAIIAAIIFLIYGGDGKVGISPGTAVGLADVPFALLDPVVTVTSGVFDTATGAVGSINAQIAGAVAAELGLAAPPFVAVFWVTEILVIAWLAWTAISAVDVPFVRVLGVAKAATRPARRLIGRLT